MDLSAVDLSDSFCRALLADQAEEWGLTREAAYLRGPNAHRWRRALHNLRRHYARVYGAPTAPDQSPPEGP